MRRTLKAAVGGGVTVFDRVVHFAMGSVVAFCGLMLPLPLVMGAFDVVTGV